ncbi:MAG: class I SAM-dependent methyltransferase [Lachnospiraceae bacterium]|nr:class I SAM-dependent methyltransferase [Lachnospiraceae bacterium]
MRETLRYYDDNARDYVSKTIHANMLEIQNVFLSKITPKGRILDMGCGSGRDTIAFLKKGYKVNPIDGSEEMCRLASMNVDIPVRCMNFLELHSKDKYDGIWACASLLHLDSNELKEVLYKMVTALKVNGAIYASFKFGDFQGIRDGRYFHDYTEFSFRDVIEGFNSLNIEMSWLTDDTRPGHSEKWLNLILRKTGL